MNRMMYNIFKILPDKLYLQILYFKHFRKFINFHNPKTFNEKLQWLKLYNRKPEYKIMVDKYSVREYIKDKIGEKYLIPLLGVWDSTNDIELDKLPNQFVLKCNHDSGSIVICKDKSKFDFENAKKILNKGLQRDGFYYGREWPYKGITKKIICEKYMEDKKTNELRDYKFFCFNGKVEMILIASERQNSNNETKFNFYDKNFNLLNFTNGHPNSKNKIMKPRNLKKMIKIAEKLSNGIPHIRVDLYDINGEIYFGELTFFHWSGFVPFKPEEWDYKLGKLIDLEKVKKNLYNGVSND